MNGLAMPNESLSIIRQAARIGRRVERELILGSKAMIGIVHHFACTGGTVISKCLATMPKVALISESQGEGWSQSVQERVDGMAFWVRKES